MHTHVPALHTHCPVAPSCHLPLSRGLRTDPACSLHPSLSGSPWMEPRTRKHQENKTGCEGEPLTKEKRDQNFLNLCALFSPFRELKEHERRELLQKFKTWGFPPVFSVSSSSVEPGWGSQFAERCSGARFGAPAAEGVSFWFAALKDNQPYSPLS